MEFLPTQKKVFCWVFLTHFDPVTKRDYLLKEFVVFVKPFMKAFFIHLVSIGIGHVFFLRPLKGLLTYLKRFFWDNDKFAFMVRGRSQTMLTQFWLFLTTCPPLLTFSMLWTLTKSGHFWTTYPPPLANIVFERPLKEWNEIIVF